MKLPNKLSLKSLASIFAISLSLGLASCGLSQDDKSPNTATNLSAAVKSCNPQALTNSTNPNSSKVSANTLKQQDQGQVTDNPYLDKHTKGMNDPTVTDVEMFIHDYIQHEDIDSTETHYQITPIELHSGVEAYKVVIIGSYWCGTAGCDHLIVVRNPKVKTTPSSPSNKCLPLDKLKIRNSYIIMNDWQPFQDLEVLPSMRNGWHKVKLTIGGGGYSTSYRIYAYSPSAKKYVPIQSIGG